LNQAFLLAFASSLDQIGLLSPAVCLPPATHGRGQIGVRDPLGAAGACPRTGAVRQRAARPPIGVRGQPAPPRTLRRGPAGPRGGDQEGRGIGQPVRRGAVGADARADADAHEAIRRGGCASGLCRVLFPHRSRGQ
jgi:hypothetical protein